MSIALSASTGLLTFPSTNQAARRELIRAMQRICRESGADYYMLIDLTVGAGNRARILASNWMYDAIDLIGLDFITRLAATPHPDQSPPSLASEQALLADFGHFDQLGIALRAGGRRYALLLTAERSGTLINEAVARVKLLCSYALSLLGTKLGSKPDVDPLTDRERECLFWVSEGKTTEEVGVILGVSNSTANSHLTNAMQKLGARNRALAIANAIRLGII